MKNSLSSKDLKESKELKKLVKRISEFKPRDKNNTKLMLLKERQDLRL